MARELVAAGRKDRALLALKKRKLQEGQAAKLDGLLLNVEEAVGGLPAERGGSCRAARWRGRRRSACWGRGSVC